MQFKRGLVGCHVVSALDVSVWFHVEQTTSRQKNRRFKCIVYKTNKINIMKYQLYTNASGQK